MRGTIKIASNTALNNILDNYNRLLKVQNQMSTGRRVVDPSDDALAANAGMRLDTLIAQTKQFNRNIDVGNSFLALSDSALGDVNDILKSAKSLTIGSANETTTQEMRRANAVEMNSLLQELISVANRQNGQRYIFGGTETKNQPYEMVGGRFVHYSGNEKDISLQVDHATNMAINVTGEQAFGAMETVIASRDITPDINMAVDMSTRLQDLNTGTGVQAGSINVLYTAFPNLGLDIDLTGADTLEDVKDIIERASIEAANQFTEGADPEWEVVLQVNINEEHNGIQVEQWRRNLTGAQPPFLNAQVDHTLDPTATPLTIAEVGSGTTARDLGIIGTGTSSGVSVLAGTDTDPAVTKQTLLADLAGFSDATYTITNGAEPDKVFITDVNDTQNNLDNWDLNGLVEGVNTTDDGELFTRVTNLGGAPNRFRIEVFSDEDRLPTQLVASGEGESGTVVLTERNTSGVSGSVSINPPAIAVGGTLEFSIQAQFDPTFRSTVSVPAFVETGTVVGGVNTEDFTGNWHIRGLQEGVSTDINGNVYVQMEEIAGPAYEVRIYNDPAFTNLVASGQLQNGTNGQVELTGAAGFESVTGSVHLEWPREFLAPNPANPGPHSLTLKSTFATVGDLINAVNESNTYVEARISEDGQNFEFVSKLGGAYLSVAESMTSINQMGDEQNQLTRLNLNGMVKGENTDAYGNLFVEIEDLNQPGGGPYEVRLYKDAARTELVATGNLGVTTGTVALSEANDSGLSGTVELNYLADDNSITVYPGGIRRTNDELRQISEVDFQNLIPGTNTDLRGNLHVELEDLGGGGAGPFEVRIYSDPSHTNLVASGQSLVANGPVTLNEVNNSGLGAPASTATLRINYTADDNDIILRPGGLRMGGQDREQNIFSTFNDIIESMGAHDTDKLGELIGNFDTDLDRVLLSRADIGSRQQRMELLSTRHEDEEINFGKIRSDRIDLDFAEAIVQFQAQQNAFDAALRTTGQIIPLSLVDFI